MLDVPMRASLARTIALVALAFAHGGCPSLPGHRCDPSGDRCGPAGRCEPIGVCAFPEVGCASGWAYGDEVAGDLAGTCTPPDEIAPAAIAGMTATTPTTTTATVYFVAPGDDGAVGTAASYDLRWATAPITDATWAAATPVAGEPTPGPAGAEQTITVTGLTDSTPYFFAIKTTDDASQESPLSNVATATTPPPGSFTLTYTKDGTGSGTVISDPPGINCRVSCAAGFANNTLVTLTATPDVGSTFVGWTGLVGGCMGTGTCAVTLNADKGRQATFTPQ